MQLDGKLHAPQRHVLHDEGIDPRGDERTGLRLGVGQLPVEEQRIERGVDAHAVLMGVLHGAGHLLDRVAGAAARTEFRAADVDGVGAVVDGGHGGFQVPGGSEQFNAFHEGFGLIFGYDFKGTKIRFFSGSRPISEYNR